MGYRKFTCNQTDAEINQVIEEMMGFSLDTDVLASSILKYVKSEVKAGCISRDSEMDKIFTGGEVYTLDDPISSFPVAGKETLFVLRMYLVNFPADADDEEIYSLAEEHCDDPACTAVEGANGAPMFEIECFLVFKGWKLKDYAEDIFQHEIKHAYTHVRTIGDGTFDDMMVNNPKAISMNRMYDAAIELKDNEELMKVAPKVAGVAIGMYVSDKNEISSFTQEAFTSMKHVRSFSEVDDSIKKTNLYNNYVFLKKLYSHLEKNEETYDRFALLMNAFMDGEEKMPTRHLFMKILSRRIKKYSTNIGRVIVYTKDRLRDGGIREGYSIPIMIYDGTWCDIYKLRPY